MGGKSKGGVEETPQQRAMAEHGALLLQDYKKRWLPVQQRLAKTIQGIGEPDSAARALATGKASTDIAIQFARGRGALEKSLTATGAGPGSARFKLATAGMGEDIARSTGMGTMIAEQQIDDAYTQGLGALMALGRGERAQVGTGLAQQATQSARQAQADAEASLMNRMGNAQVAGQAVGLGLQQWMQPAASSAPATTGTFSRFDRGQPGATI
jgi:hypothetical protein